MAAAYIIDAVRTPRSIGKMGKGALSRLHPQHVAAAALSAIKERNALETGDVDDVIWGTSDVGHNLFGRQLITVRRAEAAQACERVSVRAVEPRDVGFLPPLRHVVQMDSDVERRVFGYGALGGGFLLRCAGH